MSINLLGCVKTGEERVSRTKVCSTCKIEKLLEDFGNDARDKKRGGEGRRSECKECRCKWSAEHFEEIAKNGKIYRDENKIKIKEKKAKDYIKNKDKISKQQSEYYKNNKEKILETNKKYRLLHSEEIKATGKKYYELNKEKSVVKSMLYASKHPEKIKEIQSKYKKSHKKEIREYYINNREYIAIRSFIYGLIHKEEISEKKKKYRSENRDKLLENQREHYIKHRVEILKQMAIYQKTPAGKANSARTGSRRRSKTKSVENTLTDKQWNKILKMQNNCCANCGKQFSENFKPTRDHIIPVSLGGGLTFGNVQALCKRCNSSKNSSVGFLKAIDKIIMGEYESPK